MNWPDAVSNVDSIARSYRRCSDLSLISPAGVADGEHWQAYPLAARRRWMPRSAAQCRLK